MRFNSVAEGRNCLVDVDLPTNSVTIYGGHSSDVVLARYQLTDVKLPSDMTDKERAEKLGKFALGFYGATSHLGTEIQGIKYREQSPGFEGALTLQP